MYRENAQLVDKKIDDLTGVYQEHYKYRCMEYWIEPDSETPSELQHKFEQDFIDYYISKEDEAQLQDWLEEIYPEDFC